MRATEFVYGLLERFSPMSEKSSVELKTDAEQWFYAKENEAKEIDRINSAIATLKAKAEDKDITEDQLSKVMAEIERLEGERRPQTLAHKFIGYANNWIFRTCLAMLFIYLIPVVQGYLNPDKPDVQEDDNEEYED